MVFCWLFQLEEQKEDMQKEVTELWGRISCLWDRLEISEAERSHFKKDKSGIKAPLIEAVRPVYCISIKIIYRFNLIAKKLLKVFTRLRVSKCMSCPIEFGYLSCIHFYRLLEKNYNPEIITSKKNNIFKPYINDNDMHSSFYVVLGLSSFPW